MVICAIILFFDKHILITYGTYIIIEFEEYMSYAVSVAQPNENAHSTL